MKICWDNLEKLNWDKKLKILRDKHKNIYFFKDECKTCKQPFLGGDNGKYCSKSCAHKGKPKSKNTKEKMSKSGKKKNFSKDHRRNISIAVSGEKNGFYGKHHSKETIETLRRKLKGKTLPKEFVDKQRKIKTHTIQDYKKKHPFFCKIEEIKNNDNGIGIQVHCKYNKCKNSKENGGWFTPSGSQIAERIRKLEHIDEIGDGCFFYCSKECKEKCPLYHLHGDPFVKNKNLYTAEEYQTFRKFVLERDGYICQFCGVKATDVHHEQPQKLEPFFALDPDLAWSCCKKCHYKYGHTKGTNCSTGNLAKEICI